MTVYEERQRQKQLIKDYKEEAKLRCMSTDEDLRISVPQHGSVTIMDDGAFVDILLWIPLKDLI